MSGYRIFFSHGSEDTYVVKHFLVPKVQASGATVFLDDGKIEYGDDFRAQIIRELVQCNELLVLLTKSSIQRPWVLAVVGAMLIQNRRIVAIRYGPTEGELQQIGLLSLLGDSRVLQLDDFDRYIDQLKTRVNGYPHG